jgi:hypothetical protein
MAHSPADLPELYRDPVNTARETRARFRYQDECVALRCIPNLISGRVVAVVVEWSSDYLMVGAGGTVEMVSIKHREPDQPAWTPSALRPVLIDLHGYWRATDERCECVFASSIGVTGDVTKRASALLDGAVPEPEAARFWQALRLPDATTVLPRRNEITAVGVREMHALLEHLDRDPAYAEGCYAALVSRIARASIDEPPTPRQRIARLSGTARSILDSGGPDLAGQTLRMEALRALVLATHDDCATDHVPQVVVRRTVPAPPADPDWRGGARVRAGTGLFLVHEPVLVDTAPDGGSVCRRAKARQLEPAGRDVWLTQIGLRQDTPTGRGRLRALRREADLLAELSTAVGVPRLVDFQAGDASAALVTEQPGSRPLVDVFGPPGPPYPGFVLDAVLRGCATLVEALTALHARRHAHRALAPHALLVTARGGVVLRDLGLAAYEATPGEGSAEYRAPEQDRPLLVPPGPHTDVYQLAAIVYHLATGQPAGPTPMPPSVLRPELSHRLDRPLLAALATDVTRRPTLGRLGDELDGIVRAGGTAVAV